MTWIMEYESDDGRVRVENLDGISWLDAPLPPRIHRCKAQTRGWTNWFNAIERCACGASYIIGGWTAKNETRNMRKKVKS